jgi:hypothetical protein
MTCDSKINLYICINQFQVLSVTFVFDFCYFHQSTTLYLFLAENVIGNVSFSCQLLVQRFRQIATDYPYPKLLTPKTYNMTCDSKINLYICINQFQVLTIDRLNEINNMSRCYICQCIYKISFGPLIYNKS